MIRQTKGDSPDYTLQCHIMNAGIGESIAVRLPNGKWGVVDCYSPSLASPDRNPVLQFLLSKEVQGLEFLCLTHPHDDHYRGMSQLLDAFPVNHFWRFAGLSICQLITYLKQDSMEQVDQERSESAMDLQKTFATVARKKKARELTVTQMSDFKPLYTLSLEHEDRNIPIEIYSLAPPSGEVERYEESLGNCFESDALKSDLPTLKHNLLSAALLLRFGQTRVILGGDVEDSAWRQLVSQAERAESPLNLPDMAVQAVKVSHHGSCSGYSPGLWSVFSTGTSPVAIITPSRRHQLPQKEAVAHISKHASYVSVTCKRACSPDIGGSTSEWFYQPDVHFAVSAMFGSFSADPTEDLGICSLTFDDCGSPPSVEYHGTAGRL